MRKKLGALWRYLAMAVAGVALAGCVPAMQAAPPVANGPPVQVDIAKWSSGMYPDLYADRRVVVEGYYIRTGFGAEFHQGAPDIGFLVSTVRLGYGQNTPKTHAELEAYTQQFQNYAAISASAPMAMRDQLFNMKNGQRIRVQGVARRFGVYDTLLYRNYAGVVMMVLVADSIEPIGS